MLRLFPGDGDVGDYEHSRTRGQPIAWICKRGPGNPPLQTVFIKGKDFPEDDLPEEQGEPLPDAHRPTNDELLPVRFFKSLHNISTFNKDLLRKAIREDEPSLLSYAKPSKQSEYLSAFYSKAQEQISTMQGTHFVLHREEKKRKLGHSEPESTEEAQMDPDLEVLVPVPLKAVFQSCIFGPTGVGKSYWAASTLMRGYEYYNPDNEIVVWSFFEFDPAFEKLSRVTYHPIDDRLIDRPPKVEDFENKLLVFDDVESLPVQLREVVLRFRDQCLATGRKHNVSTIAIAHEIFGGHTTKSTLLECEQVVIFNQGMVEPLIKLMKRKYNMSRADINFVLASPTRWVMIKRSYPQAIVTPREIKIM